MKKQSGSNAITPSTTSQLTPFDRFQQAVKQVLAVKKSDLPIKTAKKP